VQANWTGMFFDSPLIGDHIITKCSCINKKCEANYFLKMFLDRGSSFNGLKHLTEKVTAVASLTRVRVVVNHTMPTQPTAKINKVKDLALIF